MAERTPPSSIDAEKAALGSVLIKPSAIVELDGLDIDDFLLPVHREIFEAMRALVARRRAIDVVTLSDELKARGMLSRLDGGEAYLLALGNFVPTAENIVHYARVISQKATLRRTIAACAEIMSAAYGDVVEVEEFLAEARAKVSALELRGQSGLVRMGDEMALVLDRIQNRAADPDAYVIRTGIGRLDHAIGGFRAGQMAVIAANPGRGKTALAWNCILRAAARGVPCALFSLEMTRHELIERALAFEAKINGRHIVQGTMTADEWKRMNAAAGRLYERGVWINEENMTARRLCSEARRWAARHGGKNRLKLIGIDYLGLVTSEEEGSINRAREVGKMTRAFKQLAKELMCPVVLLAQLNRENVKGGKDGKPRAPVMSDLRDSGEIEQDADMVLFPWWEGDPVAGRPHPASIIVGKQRNGPVGPVPCQWEREFMTFSDVEPEPEEPEQMSMGNL